MNIVFLTEYYPHAGEITGGIESRSYHLSRELAKKNNVVVLTSWRKGQPRRENIGNIEIHRVGNNHPYTNKKGYLSRLLLSLSLYKYGMKLKNVEVVHSKNFTTYLSGYLLSRKLRVPFFSTYHETWVGEWINRHGIFGLPYEFMERLLLKLPYDKIISVSEETKKRLLQHGIKKTKISVIHNGVNPILQKELKRTADTLVFAGRLIDHKKVDVLINSISLIKEKKPHIRCKIIGDGPELPFLKRMVEKLGLKDNVSFLGFLKKHDDVLKEISKSTLFVHPGTVEGYGIVLIEAAACSTPFVCTNLPVFREITNEGKGGLFFRENDEEDLADKLIYLLDTPKAYKEKIVEAKELVAERTWENSAKQLIDEYKRVLAKNI